ncbi:MAG: hypothetical protein HONBIEJF_00619 [Fimbriimonadaceae bacterium]|nr:hypothetical protein [Fimbriimonadaceae bacterium]
MRRAAERQTADRADGSLEGVSEDELRAAASELGIAPEVLDEILEEEESIAVQERAGFWGGPFSLESEAILDGNLSDEAWEETVAELRQLYGETGAMEQRGNTREWSGTGGGMDANTVTLTQAGDSVRARLQSRFPEAPILGYLIGSFVAVIGGAILGKAFASVLLGIGSVALIFGGITAAIRVLSARSLRRRQERMQWIIGRLRRRLATSATDVVERLSQATLPELSTPGEVEQRQDHGL